MMQYKTFTQSNFRISQACFNNLPSLAVRMLTSALFPERQGGRQHLCVKVLSTMTVRGAGLIGLVLMLQAMSALVALQHLDLTGCGTVQGNSLAALANLTALRRVQVSCFVP